MNRVETADDITRGLDALVFMDRRLELVRAAAGVVPLRRNPAGFHSLASVIVSQQVSRASADAIFGRLRQLADPLTPDAILTANEDALAGAGLSRAKQRALVALASAIREEAVNLDVLGELPAEQAIAALTGMPGVGPWTAQVYLLVAAGHADIFPAGDVALQAAVAHAFGFESRPNAKKLARIAESWSPWRAVAARLFWAYYREMRGWEAAPAA